MKMRQTSGEAQDAGERKPDRASMLLTAVLALHQAGRFMCISSVQSLTCVQLFVTPLDCSMPDFPVHHQLPELA